jgi:uncharacterized protein (TIGR03032 family)
MPARPAIHGALRMTTEARPKTIRLQDRESPMTDKDSSTGPAPVTADAPAPQGPVPAQPAIQQGKVEISFSRQFASWLREVNASLIFTTYQVGRFFLIGRQDPGRLAIVDRGLPRCMAVTAHDRDLYISSLRQVWRYTDSLAPGQEHQGADRLYVPRTSYVTGDLDIHDLAVDHRGRVLMVNTLHSCIAALSERHSFEPLWRPPFISRLAAEDRCHLNGMAMEEGRPRYVTAVSDTDVVFGWRDHRQDGGIVIDVPTGKIVTEGLSMPHSPRLHQGKLWILNSGAGFFGFIDPDQKQFVPVAFCPGYLRGLAFVGDYAVLGVSKCRKNHTFGGLALDGELAKRKIEPRCGLFVIDLRTSDLVHWAHIEGVVDEIYDVTVLPDVRRPYMITFQDEEVQRTISIGPEGKLD